MANNYGSNINSFSEGLMTGYNFVDAIFDRRQQAKDRQRALELENERVAMARESHKSAMTDAERGRTFEDQDRAQAAGDRVGKEANDLAAYHGGVDKVPADLMLQTVRKHKPDATPEEATSLFGTLAMRGGDYIEGAAMKERDRQTLEDTAAGVLSTGAPKAAPATAGGPTAAVTPTTSGGGRGGRNRAAGGKSFAMLQFEPGEEAHIRRLAGDDPNADLFLRIAPTIENRGSRANMYSGNVSSAGAAGPYQFMAATAQSVGLDPAQRNDFFASASGARALYDDLNKRYNGNMRAMLADYNGGPAAGAAVMKGELPPAKETQEYLRMADELIANGAASFDTGPAADTSRRVPTPDPPRTVAAAEDKTRPAFSNRPDTAAQHTHEADKYAAQRKAATDGIARASLDTTVRKNLSELVFQASREFDSATDPKLKAAAGRKLFMLRGQLADVSHKAQGSSIDSRMPRSSKPGPVPAAAMAVAVQDQQGMPKQSTPDELRLLGTQMDRLAAAKQERYSPENVKRVARAVSLGVITMEQGKNLLETGTMDKREKTQYVNVGEGYVIADNGESREIIDLSAHVAARKAEGKEGSLKAEQRSLRHRANVEYADKQLTAMQEDGEFDFHWLGGGAKPHAVVGGFFESVSKAAPQLKTKYGIDVMDPDTGTMTLGHLSEGEIQSLIGWYSKQRSENQDAWLFPEQKDLSQYGPQVSAPSDGGYKITPVQ